MRLPRTVLESVRGAAVAAALGACGAPPAPEPTPIVPEAPLVPVAAPVPLDPVAYDAATEAARLDAMERDVGAAANRRNRRIAVNEAAAARLAIRRRPGPGFPGYPPYVHPACGRG